MDRRRVLVCGVAALLAGRAGGLHAQGAPQGALGRKEGVAVYGNLRNWSSTPAIQGLEPVFEYLARTDLATLPLGRTDIEGDDVYVSVTEAETRSPDQVRYEAHRRYIDIQLVIRGEEAIGWAPVASLQSVEPYDRARDIEFFAVPRVLEKSGTFGLRAGDFVVFAPGDAHRPSLHLDGPHVSRKAVVKVSVAYRERQRGGPPPA